MRIKLLVLISSAALAGCAAPPAPVTIAPPPPDLMRPPCQMLPPVSDADEDLAVDVQNLECVRTLRLQVYRLQSWIKIASEGEP